jgi:mono/diheme cytochrome c family protein
LKAGRDVLLGQCTGCHDLRTILEKPRPPKGWAQVVSRMAEKPSLFKPLTDLDQWHVTAYLIAITPDLQRSAKARREATAGSDDEISGDVTAPTVDAGVDAIAPTDAGVVGDAGVVRDAGVNRVPDAQVPAVDVKPSVAAVDPVRAKAMFDRKCSGCHEIADIDAKPPKSRAQVNALVARMIVNGLEASRRDLDLIRWYLDAHYVKQTN